MSATKQSAVEELTLDLNFAYDNETRHSDRIFATEDAKEGPRAFAEKRTPIWQAADVYRLATRLMSRLASDSSQLTIDSTIAAQIAVHQK